MALRTGEPVLTPEVTDELLRTMCHDEEHCGWPARSDVRTALSVPLIARGQTLGVLSLASDAPGRRYGRADLELAVELGRRAANAIDNARLYRASQQALSARNEFLTVASHELKTPLTSLTLSMEALHRAAHSGRPIDPHLLDQRVERISHQGTRLTRLVSNLLDVSRIDTGPLPLERTDVDLGALVREVDERFEPDFARAHCSVSIQTGAPVVGRWDRSRLDRVVTNLLSNAVKFGAGKPIEIAVGAERGTARLAVQDHGIGIDPDQRDRSSAASSAPCRRGTTADSVWASTSAGESSKTTGARSDARAYRAPDLHSSSSSPARRQHETPEFATVVKPLAVETYQGMPALVLESRLLRAQAH